MAKTIVTGGAGFIGSHLVDKLLELGHEVTVIDNFSTGRRQNLGHIEGRVRIIDSDLYAEGEWTKEFVGADWTFHLAALADIVPSITNPVNYYDSNVTATLKVLEASVKCGVKRFIYSASSSCYGIPDFYPTSEQSAINPQYPYALTKRMGEELVLHWSMVYGLPAISLRFFNVYGTRSRTSGTYGAVFGVFLAQKLANKPMTVVGNGEQTRDFTYVSDVVDALIAAGSSDKTCQIYNVGSGRTTSINRLVELLGGSPTYIPQRPGEPNCTFADIRKIQHELNWVPRIKIEDGIRRILDDIEYWREAPVWTPTSIASATEVWFKYLK